MSLPVKNKEVPEGFKEIPGFPGYFCNKSGVVLSAKRKNMIPLKAHVHKEGYLKIVLYDSKGKRMNKWLHQIVALTWIKKHNSDKRLVVNHLNGIKTDCRVENLEWVTDSQNQRHSRIALNKSKLRPNQVLLIRKRMKAGESGKELAFEFNVRPSTIYNIEAGRLWSWL